MLKILNYSQNASQKYEKYLLYAKNVFYWIIPHPSAKFIMVLVCPFTSVNIQIKWVDL